MDYGREIWNGEKGTIDSPTDPKILAHHLKSIALTKQIEEKQ